MITLAVTGLHGVVGSRIYPMLKKQFRVVDLYHSHAFDGVAEAYKVNLLHPQTVISALKKCKAQKVLHLASMAHIDACEEDKKHGKKGKVWRVNVDATKKIAEYCAAHDIHMVYLSTECVFSGVRGNYKEHAKKNPKNWYGVTKHQAEEAIKKTGVPHAILRSVIAFHDHDNGGTMFGKFEQGMIKHNTQTFVDDQWFTPTHTDDIGKGLVTILQKGLQGVFHVCSKKEITPHRFASYIAKRNNISQSNIKGVSMNVLLGKKKASLRLKHASLDCTTSLRILGMKLKSVKQTIDRMKA